MLLKASGARPVPCITPLPNVPYPWQPPCPLSTHLRAEVRVPVGELAPAGHHGVLRHAQPGQQRGLGAVGGGG